MSNREKSARAFLEMETRHQVRKDIRRQDYNCKQNLPAHYGKRSDEAIAEDYVRRGANLKKLHGMEEW